MHEGIRSQELASITGIPSACEYAQLQRDLALVRESSGCRYHVCHMSAQESVDSLRKAYRSAWCGCAVVR